MLVPIGDKFLPYCEKVATRLKLEGYSAHIDTTAATLNKKVRNAQLAQYNYIGVIGEEEEKSGCIDIRERDKNERLGKFTVDKLVSFFKSLDPPQSTAELESWKNAYKQQADDELSGLNEELKYKVYLEGEGH